MVQKLKRHGFDPAAVALMAELDELVNELNALDSPGRSVLKWDEMDREIWLGPTWEKGVDVFFQIDRQVAINKWLLMEFDANGVEVFSLNNNYNCGESL
jgi:hypothetical protein